MIITREVKTWSEPTKKEIQKLMEEVRLRRKQRPWHQKFKWFFYARYLQAKYKLEDKIKLNFIQRNFFTFIIRYEIWNKDKNPYEIRIMFLWWEFNFTKTK